MQAKISIGRAALAVIVVAAGMSSAALAQSCAPGHIKQGGECHAALMPQTPTVVVLRGSRPAANSPAAGREVMPYGIAPTASSVCPPGFDCSRGNSDFDRSRGNTDFDRSRGNTEFDGSRGNTDFDRGRGDTDFDRIGLSSRNPY